MRALKKMQFLTGLVLCLLIALLSTVCVIYIPVFSSPVLALFLGLLLGNLIFHNSKIRYNSFKVLSDKLKAGEKFAESKLIECSVALLGFSLTFKVFTEIGIKGFGFIIFMMYAVIISTLLIGKLFKLPLTTKLMLAGGNAVCGNAAISAIAPEINADASNRRSVIALVNLQGTILMFIMPVIAILFFSDSTIHQGMLIGGTLQSVGQVVGSASAHSLHMS